MELRVSDGMSSPKKRRRENPNMKSTNVFLNTAQSIIESVDTGSVSTDSHMILGGVTFHQQLLQ
jgi:hypothetical protein